MLVILVVLFSPILSISDCDQRTPTFLDHGPSNQGSYFFAPETFRAGRGWMTQESCASNQGSTTFRALINSQYPCSGVHCQLSASTPWGCLSGNSQSCYNVEHIIPTGHNITELQGCSVNIIGNLVMSYGRWNQQLSNTHYGEKLLVYGDIFNQAYQTIYWCCRAQLPASIPVPDCSVSSGLSLGRLILGLIIIVVMVMVTLGVVISMVGWDTLTGEIVD